MKRYTADMHIHSCLSPCGSLEMSPSAILKAASQKGLDLIAIADHNTTRNIPALANAAGRYPDIVCAYGMEVTTQEEVHVVCLFEHPDAAVALGERVLASIPGRQSPMDQVYVDAHEGIEGRILRDLIQASSMELHEVCAETHAAGGLCIPAHIDKLHFSILAQLGFIPDEPFDALELSGHTAAGMGCEAYVQSLQPQVAASCRRYAFVTSSDAHYLDDIGRFHTEFEADARSFAGFAASLHAGRVTMHHTAR